MSRYKPDASCMIVIKQTDNSPVVRADIKLSKVVIDTNAVLFVSSAVITLVVPNE